MPDHPHNAVCSVPYVDGRGATDRLIVLSEPGYFIQPMIDCSGRRVVFWGKAREGRGFEIQISDIDGGNRRPLTDDGRLTAHPFWSADGQTLIYIQSADANLTDWSMRRQFYTDRPATNLWLMDVDGANRRQLTDGDCADDRPCLSPDGRYAVFVSTRSGENHLWAMELATGKVRQITHEHWLNYRPIFSPDGQYLAFFRGDEPITNHDLCLMRWPDGPIEMPLSREVFAWAHGPFWHGADHLLFHANTRADNRFALWMLDLTDRSVHRIEMPGLKIYTHGSLTPDGRMLVFDTPDEV